MPSENVPGCLFSDKVPDLLVLCFDAEQDRLEVRRETNEQDKHLDVISDALTDLQRIGEVTSCTIPCWSTGGLFILHICICRSSRCKNKQCFPCKLSQFRDVCAGNGQ